MGGVIINEKPNQGVRERKKVGTSELWHRHSHLLLRNLVTGKLSYNSPARQSNMIRNVMIYSINLCNRLDLNSLVFCLCLHTISINIAQYCMVRTGCM
jgi:hypothetical protein